MNCFSEVHCKCHKLAIVCLRNGDPVIIEKGPQDVSFVKEKLGIAAVDTLTEILPDGKRLEHENCGKVVIRNCQVFYGIPPAAGSSKESIEKTFSDQSIASVFGTLPKVLREAGNYLVLFEGIPIDGGKKVDMLFEWPAQKRLLFSERIPTQNLTKPNWAYQDMLLGGRRWQGLSLRSGESDPLKVLLSYFRVVRC